ncbi:XRN 5'-3' exonuclease [Onchocerca flexuosa]|uniref:5'-3' exoribonuclease n=1 Tax=Onchocerca flexuosa TaxID=387005 RepID=A0A238C6V6_9BILA|nr:XRN 5'-3' exonuclease [Onchocerca flexuosa]
MLKRIPTPANSYDPIHQIPKLKSCMPGGWDHNFRSTHFKVTYCKIWAESCREDKKDSTVTMGVPAFFRWLTRKYPSVIVDAVEEKPRDLNGIRIPVNTTDPNPNFQEFDNLYLDMNGIIHPCTHPEDRPSPKTEEEMFVLIFEYIDRLFAIVRPRKLLYMAIDGVAPRAKMNQQRSRRFRASKEAVEKVEQIAEIRSRLESEGYPLPPEKEKEHFDSNCITPGTPFMARLAVALRYYIHQRLNSDPGWEKIAVILSDANVPGEGEHKIMDFIRRQRASPSHDPNTVHCLCGADADLIMLGLATHEPNFNIIREEFVPNQQRPCDLCGQYGHELNDCKGLALDDNSECQSSPLQKETNFIFVRLPVLREYLERELYIPNSSIPFDLERAIDDWVFMCFFVGNDFLPHLPSLEIRENAIDRLVKLYKDMVCEMKGYLTDSGIVSIQRAQIILNKLGEVEDEIFKSRQEREQQFKRKNKERKWRERAFMAPSYIPSRDSLLAPQTNGPMYFSGSSTRAMARTARLEALNFPDTLRTQTVNNVALHIPATNMSENNDRKHKLNNDSSSEDEISDEVRLWEDGWKDRYYKSKFQVDGKDIVFRRKVALAYIEGLCWVLHYYYQGCASWDWYYPFHYAPFASDFDAVSEFKLDFSAHTEPFKPLQQLMGVFPAASRMHLPEAWQDLMISSASPIIDFYPDKFVIDLNGKKYAWQGIALLPFVDEKRLLEVLKPDIVSGTVLLNVNHVLKMEDKLDAFEKERNSRGPDRLFVGSSHPFYKFAEQLYEGDKEGSIALPIDTSLTFGMAGTVGADAKAIMKGENYKSPFLVNEFADIAENKAIMMIYKDPQFEKGYVFAAKRLSGAIDVPRTLKDINLDRKEPYRPQIGFSREIPRHGLSDAGRRMLGHNIGHGPRPLFEAYQIDSHNRPHQSSSWIPAGSYAEDRMPNYSPTANQFRERRQTGGEWYGNSRRYRNFNEYERISQLPLPLRHPFRYEPYPELISSRARSRGRDRPLQHSVYRW